MASIQQLLEEYNHDEVIIKKRVSAGTTFFEVRLKPSGVTGTADSVEQAFANAAQSLAVEDNAVPAEWKYKKR